MDRGDTFGMYALSHAALEHLVCTAYGLNPDITIIRQEDDGTLVAVEHVNHWDDDNCLVGYRTRRVVINLDGNADAEEDGGC